MIGEGLKMVGLGILKKIDSFYIAVEEAVDIWLENVTAKLREKKLKKATDYVKRNGYQLSVSDRVKVAGKVWYVGEIAHNVGMNNERIEITLVRPHEYLEIRRAKYDYK